MSIVTIQFGQCGNQVGAQLFSTVINDCCSSVQRHAAAAADEEYCRVYKDRFFSVQSQGLSAVESCVARAVLVDTEQKVVAQTVKNAAKSGSWQYPSSGAVQQKCGSGNNWALGFCGYGPEIEEEVMNAVRREVEKCDRLGGFLSLMSLAGGTGSGVGSYITSCVCDEYPHAFVANQVVWPYESGEVAVQNYNAVLSLAHLYQSTTAIITVDNDDIQRICSQILAISKVSLDDINRVISLQLASVLAPVWSAGEGESLHRNTLGDLLERLVPYAEYKILTLRTVPLLSERSVNYSVYQWPALLKHLRQMVVTSTAVEAGLNWQVKSNSPEANKALAHALFLRGTDCQTADTSSFIDPDLYSSNTAVPCSRLAVYTHPRRPAQLFTTQQQQRFAGAAAAAAPAEKLASLLSNDTTALGRIERTVGRAWEMYSVGAYVHRYKSRGTSQLLDENTFMDSFATLEQIVDSYQQL